MIECFTDYPIATLGDAPGKMAPVRKAIAMSYDGNKYCRVQIEDEVLEIKAGYLYTNPVRLGQNENRIDVRLLPKT